MELMPNEYFIKENIPANLFRGIEGVGGKMYITNERVLFQPHMINIQTKLLEISIHEIVKVEKRRTMYVVPNGMKISLKSGKEHKFVVWNRSQLVELIQGTKNKLNT